MNKRKIKYIIIHCTAGPLMQSTANIQQYWRNSLGWKSPGYHKLIGASESEQLQPFELPTNGVKGFNSDAIHISYKGGDSKGTDTRTPYQKEEILVAIKEAYDYCNSFMTPEEVAAIRILGHRDFSRDLNKDGKISPNEYEKTCPCFNAEEEYAWITGHQSLAKYGQAVKQ